MEPQVLSEAFAGAFTSTLAGLLPAVPRPVVNAAARFLGMDRMEKTYASIQHQGPVPAALLRHLQISLRLNEPDRKHIPAKGPALIVANHPFGIAEGAVLAALLQEIRPDVRFLANSFLQSVPALQNLLIPIEVFHQGSGNNPASLRKALRHLTDGGLIVVFPAGEVARLDWRSGRVVDPTWQRTAAGLIRLAAQSGVAVPAIPVHIAGGNSPLFHLADLVNPHFRTALLPFELFNKSHTEIELRIGKPVASARLMEMSSDEDRIEHLRWRTDLLAARESFRAHTNRGLWRTKIELPKMPLARAVPGPQLAREIAGLTSEHRLLSNGEFDVYVVRSRQTPKVMAEIARLREVTFRAVGEGTGAPADRDSYDARYLHLFVWNRERSEIVGAYRLSPTDGGAKSLYTARLFRFDQRFLSRLGPAIELGRSFVRIEYQKSFAPLLLLWKGIGCYLVRHPQYRSLFGAVSISNSYQTVSRDLMIAFLERREMLRDWRHLVRPRRTPSPRTSADHCRDLEDLSDRVAELEPAERAGIPVLLRHYLRLGGKLLAFNEDPAFSHALDGLIVVDLTQTDKSLLERYLGKAEARAFRQYHEQKGILETSQGTPPNATL